MVIATVTTQNLNNNNNHTMAMSKDLAKSP